MQLWLLAATVLAGAASGFQSFQSAIPNGANVVRNGASWPGVGHTASSGGGARNDFGAAFAAAGNTWTTALCQADSDGDGQSNGFELGDPSCVWTTGGTPERTTDISHPGFADSTTAATPSPPSPPTPVTPAPTPQPALAGPTPPPAAGLVPYIPSRPNGTADMLIGIPADRLCVDQRHALDGADMLLKPTKHTIHCMVDVPRCIWRGGCLRAAA